MPDSKALAQEESGSDNVLPLEHLSKTSQKVPQHVAIIMDGNGRWAQANGWHRSIGHIHGSGRVKEIIKASNSLGIKFLTLYAFSTENWNRPAEEIAVLMQLLRDYLSKEKEEREMIENNIQVRALGQIERLPQELGELLNEIIEATAHNTGMVVNFCLSYGGRAEILRALQSLALDIQEGRCSASDLTEEKISSKLYTQGMPDPDLMIRTSGEYRLSNFLLWQSAYTEIYITDVPWPEFTPDHLREACSEFSKRKRRFGKSDEVHVHNTDPT